jgi:nucleoside 2-deoxyribosyltransferase
MEIYIYLAGPDVFRPDAKEYGRIMCQLCKKHGAVGIYPLDSELQEVSGQTIYEANRDLIDQSDAVVANLNPFRGPSADAGTIWEVGYACGKSLIVVGYTEEIRTYAERATETTQNQPEGWAIESFGLTDNLMIPCSLDSLVKTVEEAIVEAVRLVKFY